MAEQLNAAITVVHIYHPSVNPMNEYMIITDNELDVISKNQLNEFVKIKQSKSQDGVAVADRVEQN